MRQTAGLPYMLGLIWYSWDNVRTDYPGWYKNEGIVNDQEQPYAPLVSAMTEVHNEVRNMDPAARTSWPWPAYVETADGQGLSLCSVCAGSNALLLVGLPLLAVMRKKHARVKAVQ